MHECNISCNHARYILRRLHTVVNKNYVYKKSLQKLEGEEGTWGGENKAGMELHIEICKGLIGIGAPQVTEVLKGIHSLVA